MTKEERRVLEFNTALGKKNWRQSDLARELDIERAAVSNFIRTLKVGTPQPAITVL